jgi:hypothetical protein
VFVVPQEHQDVVGDEEVVGGSVGRGDAGSHLDDLEKADVELNQYAQQQQLQMQRGQGKLRGGLQTVVVLTRHKPVGDAHAEQQRVVGGHTYQLQPGVASYREAWQACRTKGLQLAGGRWVSDLDAITHLWCA